MTPGWGPPEPTCCICGGELDKKSRDIVDHGPMCGSCAYCFFCWKRKGKWLRRVPS